ncbi:MAG: sterol desaturase family protein, partial [Caulobacteraceae bacterium]
MPLSQFAAQSLGAVAVLGVLFLVFGALGRLFPCNPKHSVFVSKAIGLDLRYCLFGVVYAGVGPAAAALIGDRPGTPLAGHIESQPLWLQLALLLILTDLAQYWIHRAFHSRRLWPFHAIHHGAEEVNWTTTFRAHPVNYLASNVS